MLSAASLFVIVADVYVLAQPRVAHVLIERRTWHRRTSRRGDQRYGAAQVRPLGVIVRNATSRQPMFVWA